MSYVETELSVKYEQKTLLRVFLGIAVVIGIESIALAGYLVVSKTGPKTVTVKTGTITMDNATRELSAFSLATTGTVQSISVSKTYQDSAAVSTTLPSLKAVSTSGSVVLNSTDSYVRIISGDKLIANIQYPNKGTVDFSMLCTETCALDATGSQPITVEINDATLRLDSLDYLPASGQLKAEVQAKGAPAYQATLRDEQNKVVISELNERNIADNQYWAAGDTGGIIQESYADLKGLFQGNIPARLYAALYYKAGYFPMSDIQMNAPPSSPAEPEETRTEPFNFTWTNRQGRNWLTPVKYQAECGACYAFGTVATLESYINLYYNQSQAQMPNKVLSEQDIISCSGQRGCGGGMIPSTLDYLKNTGVVDEACFPYSATNGVCQTTCTDNGQAMTDRKWKATDWQYATVDAPTSLEAKIALQQKGPDTIVLGSWPHVVSLVGFGDITSGCYWESTSAPSWSCTRTIPANDPLVGKNYWLIKNSWGTSWGDGGYGKFLFTDTPRGLAMTAPPIKPANEPGRSVICQDDDQDGICWWGISPNKPAIGCPVTCAGNANSDCNDTDANIGACSAQDYCGSKPVLSSGEFSSFGNYQQYGRTSCCGDGLNEYAVGGLCCNAPTDTAATATGYSVSAYSYGGPGSGDGQFSSPGGIDVNTNVGPIGVMAVADTLNNRVQIFQLAPNSVTFLKTVGGPGSGDGQFNGPVDVALYGNTLYVVDRSNYRIQAFVRQDDGTWSYSFSFGTHGTGNGQFMRPNGISVSTSTGGNLISVVDMGTNKIQLFKKVGNSATFFQSIGMPGTGNGQFSWPTDVSFFGNKLYVCDGGNNRIQVFQQQGSNQAYNYVSKFSATCGRLVTTSDRVYTSFFANSPPYSYFWTYAIKGTSGIPEVSFPQGEGNGGSSGIVKYGAQLFALDIMDSRIHLFDEAPWPVCSSTCTDGTLNSACSTAKPSFCNNGTLEKNCEFCGCPDNTTCRVDGSCAGTNVKNPLPYIQQGQD